MHHFNLTGQSSVPGLHIFLQPLCSRPFPSPDIICLFPSAYPNLPHHSTCWVSYSPTEADGTLPVIDHHPSEYLFHSFIHTLWGQGMFQIFYHQHAISMPRTHPKPIIPESHEYFFWTLTRWSQCIARKGNHWPKVKVISYTHRVHLSQIFCTNSFFFFLAFLLPRSRHMEVPRLGVELEP